MTVFAMPPDDELPTFFGHKVTAEEVAAVSQVATPFCVGLGPLPDNLSKAQLARESRRRARRILPDVANQLKTPQAANGQLVVGGLLTTFFLTYILPSLIGWIVDKILEWFLEHEWNIIVGQVTPATCSLPNCAESDS